MQQAGVEHLWRSKQAPERRESARIECGEILRDLVLSRQPHVRACAEHLSRLVEINTLRGGDDRDAVAVGVIQHSRPV